MPSTLVTVFSARVMPLDAVIFDMGSVKKGRVERDAGIVDKDTGQPEFWIFIISLMKIRSVVNICIGLHAPLSNEPEALDSILVISIKRRRYKQQFKLAGRSLHDLR
jgi:hypothetical protein